MTEKERSLYVEYDNAESIRASNAWYQAFEQDFKDSKANQQLIISVLKIGSNVSYILCKWRYRTFAKTAF